MTNEEFAKMIEKKMNSFNQDYSGIVDELGRTHRTLQQNFTKLCVAWLQHLSELGENQYDGRNKASVDFAKRIKGEVDDAYLPMI